MLKLPSTRVSAVHPRVQHRGGVELLDDGRAVQRLTCSEGHPIKDRGRLRVGRIGEDYSTLAGRTPMTRSGFAVTVPHATVSYRAVTQVPVISLGAAGLVHAAQVNQARR